MLSEDEVMELFESEVLPHIPAGDDSALREAFNNFTDALCKDGRITPELYDEIEGPRGWSEYEYELSAKARRG